VRDRVQLSRARAKARGEVIEEIPLRLEAKEPREQAVSLLLGVPVHVPVRHRLQRNVRDGLESAALPKKAKYGADKNQMMVDGSRPQVGRQRRIEGIQLRSVDLPRLERAE